MAVNSLLSVFNKDEDFSHGLVFKHFPVEWHETDVQNYLEVITRADVNAVCIPAARCDVAVVIFGDIVYDTRIQKWQEKAFSRPVGGCYPTLELLGSPTGVFIPQVPAGVSDELLQLYFESGKSGGIEGTVVEPVELGTIEEKKYAVITIENGQALESILSKQNHGLKDIDLEVGPFYPSVHRHILETLKSRGTECEVTSIAQAEIQPVEQEVNQFLKPTDFDMSSGRQPELETRSDSSDENENFNPGVSFNSERSCDVSPLPFAGRQIQLFGGKGERFNPNVATVKPVFRQQVDTHEVQKVLAVGQYSSKPQEERHEFEQDIDLPDYKIELLVLCRFQEKHESERLKISIKQKEGKVAFKATSFEEFKAVRVDMYDCLDSVVADGKKLSDARYALLSRKQCLSWIRSKCETTNIRVVFVTDDNRKEIICHSFSEKETSRGIQLLEGVTATTVRVRPEQQICLRNHAWSTLKKSLDNDMTSVYVTENGTCICIESLIDNKAREAKQKVIQYLSKDSVNKKLATVTLEAAKARCFKACIEDKLRQEIQKKNGVLYVEQQSKSPLKLQLSCEGPECVTDELTKAVQRIWHESVDFTKLSTSVEDKCLIMKALKGEIEKDFVGKFEQKHNCFLEMSTKEEVTIQRAHVRVKDVFDSSDEEPVEESATGMDVLNDDGIGDSRDESHRPQSSRGEKSGKRRYRGGRIHELQSGLSEEEAMKKVMLLSMQDSLTEECSSRQCEVVQPDSDSDSESESLRDLAECENDQQEIVEEDTFTDSAKAYAAEDMPKKEYRDYKPHRAQRGDRSHYSRSMNISGTTVTLVKGPIAKQKADALVNVISTSQSPFEGVVAKSFLDMGGQELMQMYDEADDDSPGHVVVTKSSGQLKCSIVLHVKLKKSDHWEKIVRSAVADVLGRCKKHGARIVAFPPLGVGRMFRYPPDQVARTMLSELSRQLSSGRNNLEKISLVIYGGEPYEIFDKEFQAFNQESGNTRQNPHHQKSVSSLPPSGASHQPPSGSNKYERQNTGGQQYSGRRPPRGRSTYVASHHRGARSSSSSSGNSRGSSDRNTGGRNKQDDDRSSGKIKSSQSLFQEKVPNFSVKIIAENKEECTKAMTAFCKKVKDKFLYEEIIEKKQKISASSKRKIVNIISASDIKSIKEKDKYRLRGLKGNVSKAHSEILKVLLDEKSTEPIRKRKAKPNRETREFVEAMVSDEPEAPCYWKNYKEGETLVQSFKRFVIGKKFEKVELNKDSQQFKSILKMVNATFDARVVGQGKDAVGLDALGYTKLIVLKVERIENFGLFEKFAKKRQTLYRRLYASPSHEVRFPKIEKLQKCTGAIATTQYVHPHLNKDIHPEINEYLLFHSTKPERVSVICNDGFDPRLGSGTAMFGPGIYGAEKSTKADQYADEKDKRSAGPDNPKKMFLIRMVLGNAFLCSEPNPYKYRRPPCTRCFRDDCSKPNHEKGKFGHFFDSVVGDNSKLFREFVVYDNSLCYPEYLITYERRV
ncbi:uncharacterized protein LOC123556639 isoform X1 [Mercenaria mercenaria]|uniref:uncharacterized protein LOC123556639 isoform X1 n=1 Tax=Mercenaria mercenaria TaxID=6596 RepID=UPI00234F9FD1|nr:uncharacterized protein LOC123556639 isoform X1 [Mercenaria mercenaria]